MMNDLIRRQDAIDALWKALYEYEDETKKQFQESEDLDVRDWIGRIGHRIFVQNMNDIDRNTIIDLPSAQQWIPCSERLPEDGRAVLIYAWNVHYVIARYGSFRTENGYKNTWVTADAWNGNTEIKHEVIAWMPLPEPLGGEEDGEIH